MKNAGREETNQLILDLGWWVILILRDRLLLGTRAPSPALRAQRERVFFAD